MKLFFTLICTCISLSLIEAKSSFLVMDLESGNTLIREGDLETRMSPCSTFKIPLSLIAYTAPILFDETSPEWAFMDVYKTWNGSWLEVWSKPHNPTLWIKHSCLWYSQLITKQIGMQRLQQYLASFDYGNQDINGEPGQCDGLTHSWLSSSLKISPREQVVFLRKLLKEQLAATPNAYKMTKAILFNDNLSDDSKLFGKSGSGYYRDEKGRIDHKRQFGWFVGWVERPQGTIIFAYLLEDSEPQTSMCGPRAKALAKDRLIKLVQ